MNLQATYGVALTDETFQQEVAARREKLKLKPGENVTGCPLCTYEKLPGAKPPTLPPGQQQQ